MTYVFQSYPYIVFVFYIAIPHQLEFSVKSSFSLQFVLQFSTYYSFIYVIFYILLIHLCRFLYNLSFIHANFSIVIRALTQGMEGGLQGAYAWGRHLWRGGIFILDHVTNMISGNITDRFFRHHAKFKLLENSTFYYYTQAYLFVQQKMALFSI